MWKAIPIFLLATLPSAQSHFVLQVPPSIGFNDVNEIQAPCGGFDITSREKVTEWPIAGHPVGVVSTHPGATWQFRAALVDDTDNFIDLLPNLIQDGMGNFCLPSVPGFSDWVGRDAVFQMIQTAVDGKLYQCAAIRFVEEGAASVPGNCRNASSIAAHVDPEYTGTPLVPTATSPPSKETSSSPAATSTESGTGTSAANKSVDVSMTGMLAVAIALIDYIFM